MSFLRNIIQLKSFIVFLTTGWISFFIYKQFKRNKIRRDEEDISGKVVVITGGSAGLGKSSAREFAQRGAIVVIGSSNQKNGQNAVNEIQSETGNMNVSYLQLDLSDMDSVEQFAQTVAAEYPKIKILFNNAGIGVSKNENVKTKDGFNIHIAVNYMGHFLLTNLLMKNLEAETQARIVTMTSSFMLMSQLDLDDLNMDKSGFGFENCLPYCNTKICLALLTRELSRRCQVHSYALCPGVVDTAMTKSSDIPTLLKCFFRIVRSTLCVAADEAASEFIMFCALDKSIRHESGLVYRCRNHFTQANDRLDSKLAKNLWEKSCELVQLNERLARVQEFKNKNNLK